MTTTVVRRDRPVLRWPVVAGALVVLVAAVTGGVLWLGHPTAPGVPYTDPAATGRLALCSRSGERVSSGSTSSMPFVWRAVGSTAAPATLAGPGRVATLFAFQPRAGVPASEWSGKMLTTAARYTNPAHPMAQATSRDSDLEQFVADYPADDSGFVQLRLYLGAPGQPMAAQSYDSLDVHISGNTWQAVGGARISCTSGSAVSMETILKLGKASS